MSEKIKVTGLISGPITLPFQADEGEAIEKAARSLHRACPETHFLPVRFSIYRRSTDARRKDSIRFTYSVAMDFDEPFECDADALAREDIRIRADENLHVEFGSEVLSERPVVVGTGPAGMFCALLLAENGYRPIVIERGDPLESRIGKVRAFMSGSDLDTETNVMFGAGGAGTFSDGKLVTRISDPLTNYVLSRMTMFGAPSEILSRAKPHVGTDLLRGVVGGVLRRIEECGGEIKYKCRFDSVSESNDGLIVGTSSGVIHGGVLVLAIGHSARDTYGFLTGAGFDVQAKPFSVGVRIEHKTEWIDRAMYGSHAGDPRLGHAEYTLSDTTSGRGVYTFCMCPGGEVIAAACEKGGVVVNGMSYHARDGLNSNCAVAVSVRPSDYDGTPMGAVDFQRKIEQAAFRAGGGNFSAPVETVGDFLSGKTCGFKVPGAVSPSYDRGLTQLCDIHAVFPDFVSDELARGLYSFGKKIQSFDSPDAVLTAPETRTSSPVRILRGEDGTAPGHSRVYPCGEGAGYAGGITSAAVDGLRTAMAVMKRYKPVED